MRCVTCSLDWRSPLCSEAMDDIQFRQRLIGEIQRSITANFDLTALQQAQRIAQFALHFINLQPLTAQNLPP